MSALEGLMKKYLYLKRNADIYYENHYIKNKKKGKLKMKKYKDMNEKLNKIFDNYSHDIQRKKLAEEQYELLEALFIPPITFASTNQKENLITEIADNYVLIKQFMNKYGITDEEVLKEANRKIDRQLERIRVENLLKKGE